MSAIQIQAYPDPGQAAALWVDGSALEPEASLGGARGQPGWGQVSQQWGQPGTCLFGGCGVQGWCEC